MSATVSPTLKMPKVEGHKQQRRLKKNLHKPDWAHCFIHRINYKPVRLMRNSVAGVNSCPRCIDERNRALNGLKKKGRGN